MDYSKLADEELKTLYKKTYNSVSNQKVRRMASKILANSLYGALGNVYMRFFDIRLAESITKTGQVAVQWVERDINKYLNKILKTENIEYVIGIDTDSNILTLDSLVQKFYDSNAADVDIVDFIDNVCKEKLDKVIKDSFERFAAYTNAYKNSIKMNRDIIANKGIWTGKKHYALNVYDKEGVRYSKPKLIIKGLESQRSSTPEAFRKAIKDAVEIIMNKDEDAFIDFVEKFKEKALELPFDEFAFPRGINGLKKYGSIDTIYSKGTPAQVKGALIYNNLLKIKNLDSKYPEINDGDKIKYVYLKEPNPTGQKIISVPGRLIPPELGLDNYIDRDIIIDKGFLDPIKSIATAIKWKCEDISTLEDFFN